MLVESVSQVGGDDVELIVIDGGSNDQTIAYLEANDNRIDYWVSESDQGIYDAMNKAIARADGTYLLHLNAGDSLLQVPSKELRQAEADGIDVVAFRVSLDHGSDFHPTYGYGLRFANTLHHQGTFFRRNNFPQYDIRYRIFADFDVNQRLALTGAKARIFDQVVALHQTGGLSNKNNPAAVTEFFSIIAKNYGRKALPVSWVLCKWRGLKTRLGVA